MIKPVYYMQSDLRWGSNDYSAPGEKTNISKAGCGPTCCAMVIATLKDKDITPSDTAKWSLEHGYKACKQGTYYTYFVPQLKAFGIECTRVNHVNIYGSDNETARAAHRLVERALTTGKMVIACMGKGIWTSSGHYVLAYGLKDGKVYINDPASMKSARICNSFDTFKSQVKFYWVIEEKANNMTEKEIREIVKATVSEMLTGADSKPSAWAEAELAEAVSKGITDGTRPKGYVTREQAAIMALRASK